ncbi:DUF1382 family protein [Pseudomonas sp. CMR5c]|uniref:DUF1382 family protein n=1 Tax=Pseudomonas sp. CMR5c TaxID=658630 RepID=UPI00069DD449|nr:DUF1382 family protein [Pseudomonas sp. CMR5c]AZC19587.1 hypothetical protein C4K40_4206 [Pseudomonas sp. CMR5c]
MNRASPVQLRKAMEMASALKNAGILFVCMPVTDENEHYALVKQAEFRLEKMAQELEALEVQPCA